MEEIWKDIAGYEGYYQVSNLGRVKSLNRTIILSTGHKITVREKILAQSKDDKGYLHVNLNLHGRKTIRVHKLVALAFVPNLNNYKEINHKDEDKTNNRADNIEWCSRLYNCNYGSRNEKISKSRKGKTGLQSNCPCIPIVQYDKQMNYIAEYDCMADAERATGVDATNIWEASTGNRGRKTAGGFIWKQKQKI